MSFSLSYTYVHKNIPTYRKWFECLFSHSPKDGSTWLHSRCKGGKLIQSARALKHLSFILLQNSWRLLKINSQGNGLLHKIHNTHIFRICMISNICVVNSNEDFFSGMRFWNTWVFISYFKTIQVTGSITFIFLVNLLLLSSLWCYL